MIRIIDGKRYNTETATMIGNGRSDEGRSDFSWWDETLYITKNGRYFLAGEGGPASHWREQVGNMWGAGEGIKPLDADDALAWAERHLPAETVAAHFATMIADA